MLTVYVFEYAICEENVLITCFRGIYRDTYLLIADKTNNSFSVRRNVVETKYVHGLWQGQNIAFLLFI